MSATEAREPKLPGPDHPITIEAHPGRVVVSAGDHVVADSTNALGLAEAGYPEVLYVPLTDLDASVLHDSETTSWCPYKGTASYYSIDTGDGVIEDAIWYYPEAHEAVGQISGHAAFYPDKVQIEERA